MRTNQTVLGLLSERGRTGKPLERVYRLLYNPNLYLEAYNKIYRNKGAMTPGVTMETPDGMTFLKVQSIINALRAGTFRWKPARRTYILKKNGKKRPLGMPTWTDKVVQEVLRMLLEAYYEPQFSDHSHGFRPDRGCHTALKEIQKNWTGSTWFIEGDIKGCFENIDHEKLIGILREQIKDEQLVALIHGLLKAGYLEDWKYNATHSGTPQGGIVSPLLANIYMNALDKYIDQKLIPKYTRGTGKRYNPEYARLNLKQQRAFKAGKIAEAKAYRQQMQQLPSLDPNDPNFRRLRYVRYADDFLLGYIGTKEEAEEIKAELESFLKTIGLTLSAEKTLITHARTEKAKFLGYHIQTLKQDHVRSVPNEARNPHKRSRRRINGPIGLTIPDEVLREKEKRYTKQEKGVARHLLAHEHEYSIVMQYQAEFRGLANYYHLAYNAQKLKKLKWYMEQSLTKTIAEKQKTSVIKVYQKYGTKVKVGTKNYKAIQVVVPRKGKKPLIATWGGQPIRPEIKGNPDDRIVLPYSTSRSELLQRMQAEECELCGRTEQLEVHHIQALKDLKKYPGREKPLWVQKMAAMRRKTLVLCRTCHDAIHAGKSVMRQQVKVHEN
jgi:group II intron reverse transcriptase/maturase